jgi:ankyrin repeat protein
MQTPSSSSSSSTPPLYSPVNEPLPTSHRARSHPRQVSLQTVERALSLCTLRDQQPNCEIINTLPVGVLLLILRHLADELPNLRIICKGFKSLVEESYKDQADCFITELAAPTLHHLSVNKTVELKDLRLMLPTPYQNRWKTLRYAPLNAHLTIEEQIKKIYITAWDLLLQLVIHEEQEQAIKLIRVLLAIIPYVNQCHKDTEYGLIWANSGHKTDKTQAYAAQLFSNGFPTTFFDQLVYQGGLNSALMLVIKHFSITEASLAHQFIIHYLADAFISLDDIINIQRGVYRDFLFYAVQRAIIAKSDKIVERADNKLLQRLLARSYNLEGKDEIGQTILLFALNNQSTKFYYNDPSYRRYFTVKLLIAHGANYNATDHYGNTALMSACKYHSEALLDLLLEQPDININAINDQGKTALHQAIALNKQLAITRLLQHPRIDLHIMDKEGATFLDYAVMKPSIKTIYHLISHPMINKAPFNPQIMHNLFDAIESNSLNRVQNLLNTSFPESNIHFLALFYAIWREKEEIINILIPSASQAKKTFLNQALAFAIEHINADEFALFAKPLVELGADCNLQSAKGDTALIKACANNMEGLISYLLQRPDIDVNLVNTKGGSALDHAIIFHTWLSDQQLVISDRIKIVQALLTHEVNLALRISAFNHAVREGFDQIITVFLQDMNKEERIAFVSQAYQRARARIQINVIKALGEILRRETENS